MEILQKKYESRIIQLEKDIEYKDQKLSHYATFGGPDAKIKILSQESSFFRVFFFLTRFLDKKLKSKLKDLKEKHKKLKQTYDSIENKLLTIKVSFFLRFEV